MIIEARKKNRLLMWHTWDFALPAVMTNKFVMNVRIVIVNR